MEVQPFQLTLLDGCLGILKVGIGARRHGDRTILTCLGHEHVHHQLTTILLVHQPLTSGLRRKVVVVVLQKVLRRLVAPRLGKLNLLDFLGNVHLHGRKAGLPRAPRDVRQFHIVDTQILHALSIRIPCHGHGVSQNRIQRGNHL